MPTSDSTSTETIFETGAVRSPPAAVPGVLVVFRRGPCAPVAHRVNGPRRFGRDRSADALIDDPSLSREHLLLEPAAGGLSATDLGSRNGTFVDGARLLEPRTFAAYGSVLRLGKTLLIATPDVTPFEAQVQTERSALIGGPSLGEVRRLIEVFAPSPLPVLLEGETGTGKEVVARLLHEQSGRSGRFVAVNAAALSRDLVESELFGHARGAFSGSVGSRPGLVRNAAGGTLLLDEIGELPLAVQAKLLRFLESGAVRGVGEDAETVVNARVVAATHRDLGQMVETGSFRADLLYRIAAARIRLPALRDRSEDVPSLCAHFLTGEGVGLSVGAMAVLLRHRWPGNVRELRHVVIAAATAARRAGRAEIGTGDCVLETGGQEADATRARVARALRAAGGNVTSAARALGVARSGLYETLHRLGIDPRRFRGA
jgi:DNA-binding NtrC family response regulator